MRVCVCTVFFFYFEFRRTTRHHSDPNRNHLLSTFEKNSIEVHIVNVGSNCHPHVSTLVPPISTSAYFPLLLSDAPTISWLCVCVCDAIALNLTASFGLCSFRWLIDNDVKMISVGECFVIALNPSIPVSDLTRR